MYITIFVSMITIYVNIYIYINNHNMVWEEGKAERETLNYYPKKFSALQETSFRNYKGRQI